MKLAKIVDEVDSEISRKIRKVKLFKKFAKLFQCCFLEVEFELMVTC